MRDFFVPHTDQASMFRGVAGRSKLSALTEAVAKKLFGDLSFVVKAEWSVTITPQLWDAACLEEIFQLRLEMRPKSSLEASKGGSLSVVEGQERRTFGWEVRVQKSLVLSGSLESLRTVFVEVVLADAHKLYEFDPRIGWSASAGPLPSSFLFDPRVPFSRTGTSSACPLCGCVPSDPMWAGSNLMWVHESCWKEA